LGSVADGVNGQKRIDTRQNEEPQLQVDSRAAAAQKNALLTVAVVRRLKVRTT
jgi:hypothetical protein